jgi:Family of unknown function (DUF5343)
MPASSLPPYVPSYGSITKALEKIKVAETPSRFTQDFLATTLNMPGGGPKPVIPFLKRTGFLGTDGSPTDLYKRFRNDAHRGAAAAEALRTGYKQLYAINEFVHDAKDADLRGIVLQATGLKDTSSTVGVIIGSFKALRDFADFKAERDGAGEDEVERERRDDGDGGRPPAGINLGYTINLHLPPTPDIAVFDAIFKSLKEHLL